MGAAAVPALVIAVLFYFDHNVSAQVRAWPGATRVFQPHSAELCRQAFMRSSVHAHLLAAPFTKMSWPVWRPLFCASGWPTVRYVTPQMAQQPEFNLARPPAYAYDMLLLGAYTLACGLLGIPPVNGVLPQVHCPTAQLGELGKSRKQGQWGKRTRGPCCCA